MKNQTDLMRALLAGHTLVHKIHPEWFVYLQNDKIQACNFAHSEVIFKHPENWEIKQKMVTLNNIDYIEPVDKNFKFESGQLYYFPILSNEDYFGTRQWFGTANDIMLLQRNIIHLTEENAILHAKALLGEK